MSLTRYYNSGFFHRNEIETELKNWTNIIGTCDMGIGNTIFSSAIIASVTSNEPKLVTCRGIVINNKQLEDKIEIIRNSIRINNPDNKNGIEVLAKLWGFEIVQVSDKDGDI